MVFTISADTILHLTNLIDNGLGEIEEEMYTIEIKNRSWEEVKDRGFFA